MLYLIFFLALSWSYGQEHVTRPVCPSCPACLEDAVQNVVSRTGAYLAVSAGKVYGIPSSGNRSGSGWDSAAVLQIISRGSFYQIKGLKANLYIAMNDQGVVYAERNKESANTMWEQTYDGKRWRRYKWKGNDKGWYLAIQKNGRTKNGGQTEARQNAAQLEFVRPAAPEPEPTPAPPTTPEPAPVQMPKDQQIMCNNINRKSNEWFCGWRLAVSPDKGVYTEKMTKLFPEGDNYNVFTVFTRRHRSQMQLLGKRAGLYVAMNDDGVVYAERDGRKINSWWKVKYDGDAHDGTFEWAGNDKGWFLAVDNLDNGRLKRGNETQRKDARDNAQFLILEARFEDVKKKKRKFYRL